MDSYSAEISRANPTSFVFLIDRSASMADRFMGESGKKKSVAVADAINRLLQTLVLRSAKSDGVRDYFHVGVIGYGKDVGSALAGSLVGRTLVPISAIANNPLHVEARSKKVDDGAGGVIEQTVRFPIWLEPRADGETPMCQAFSTARKWLEIFISEHPQSFPPIVMNITDGEANDGNPENYSKDLRDLTTADGPVLLFNAHLSEKGAQPICFPNSERGLPDSFAATLFRISSILPPKMHECVVREGYPAGPGARGFVFNADLVSIIQFLDMGTRAYDWSRVK
jgi:hypothetical protein